MTPAATILTLVSPTPAPVELILQDTGWSPRTLKAGLNQTRAMGFDIISRQHRVFVRSGWARVKEAAERAYEMLPQ